MAYRKGWLVIGVMLLAAGLLPRRLGAQTCGGTERWAVKVGTDSGVGRVNLSTQIPMGVQDMLGLTEPQLPAPGDNDTRLDAETHVYVVTGHLIKFKLESGSTGDQDYHLVISDDTLEFTDDTAGQAPGHSLVAEIPNPNCIAGAHGNPSAQSRFIDSIRSARHELETQFPNITSSGFNDAGGIPVRIVGVGFFDFPHGQIGRASNNVELHPILDITFNPSAAGAFSLSATPASLAVTQGKTASTTISVTTSGGFNAPVSLSVTGAPTNSSPSLSAVSMAAPGSGASALSVTVPSSVSPGTYNLVITGAGAGQSHTATIALTVTGGDVTPPVTSVTTPAGGATVSSLVGVAATASDDVGVVKTEIYIDGAIKACNVGATSIAYPWDTTAAPNGPHTIISKAYDAAGNVGTSVMVSVTVAN